MLRWKKSCDFLRFYILSSDLNDFVVSLYDSGCLCTELFCENKIFCSFCTRKTEELNIIFQSRD